MRGYSDIVRSTSACVHFVEAKEIDEEELVDIRRALDEADIRCSYVDCRDLIDAPHRTCDAIGAAVLAEHFPYGPNGWIPLLDDMITLSMKLPGLVIILDHADELFGIDRSQIFDLVEAFLIQFHHWLKKEKPCHLCIQMSPHSLVSAIFDGR
jgi:hypothetical protein